MGSVVPPTIPLHTAVWLLCQLQNNLEFDVVFRRSDVTSSLPAHYRSTIGIPVLHGAATYQSSSLPTSPNDFLNNTHQSEPPLHLLCYVIFCSSLPHFSRCTWSVPRFRHFIEYTEMLRANRVPGKGGGVKGNCIQMCFVTDRHIQDLHILLLFEMK